MTLSSKNWKEFNEGKFLQLLTTRKVLSDSLGSPISHEGPTDKADNFMYGFLLCLGAS